MHDSIKRFLEAKLASPEFARYYEYLHLFLPELKNFSTHSSLIVLLHDRNNKDYQAKNKVLCGLITCFQRFDDKIFLDFMTFIFYPGLCSAFIIYINEFRHKDEMLGEMRSSLYLVMKEYDCAAKPSKVASTVVGRVRNHLRKMWGKQQRRAVNLSGNDPPVPDMSTIFRLLTAKMVITAEEADLIIKADIDKIPVKSMASEMGVTYDALRKRKYRAAKKIEVFIKELKRQIAAEENISEMEVTILEIILWLKR